MAILAGLDEAGYGPTLGPLVMTAVAFRVPDEHVDSCLWQRLAESCTPSRSPTDRRLPVADSKKLYHPRGAAGGLAVLERTALVMLAAAGHQPTCWRELLQVIAPRAVESIERCPWYANANPPLPADPAVGHVPTRANAVRRNMSRQGTILQGVYCEPLAEADYNQLVLKTRNKAAVLIGLLHRLLDRILADGTDPRIRVCVDRLGGRRQYRETLTLALPGYSVEIREETETRSAYRFSNSIRRIEIEFSSEGETAHFPIALASVYSKYVREIFMRIFNEYWSKLQGDLRPTAGYYTDAQRWLREASPLLNQLGVDFNRLVRAR